jgi:hypothetical protein
MLAVRYGLKIKLSNRKNYKMVVEFKTKMIKGIFVKVPDGFKNFVIKQYGFAGTWGMETDSKELNQWKIKIPKGKYNILGFSHKLKEYEVEKVLGLSMNEYFKLLTEKDITVNYSKNTGQWLVLV